MYKALKSFCGQVTMRRGELKEITDPIVVNDLLRAGYIEKFTPGPPAADHTPKVIKTAKKKKKK